MRNALLLALFYALNTQPLLAEQIGTRMSVLRQGFRPAMAGW
jgi:hypothetical protein